MSASKRRAPEEMRRRDRAVEDEKWVRAFLHSGAWGALATIADDQPFINTNLYVYDEKANVIYLHTARAGRTRSNIEGDDRACFSVSEMGRLLPADTALEFSVEYAGVTVFGRGRVVDDDKEKSHALQILLDKYAPHLKPGRDYRPSTQEELDRTSVFRLDIERLSAKKKEVEADFSGAFWYDEYRLPTPFKPGGAVVAESEPGP